MTANLSTSTRAHTHFGWPIFFAVYDILLLAFLLSLALPVWDWWDLLRDIKGQEAFAGFIPLIAPWGGALGGVMISLVGAADHFHDWNNKWNVWHFARPFLGATSGLMALVIVALVLKVAETDAVSQAGGTAATSQSLSREPEAMALYFIIGFAVGFRDSVFLELVSRVLKVIFASGAADKDLSTWNADPKEVEFRGENGNYAVQMVRITFADASLAPSLTEASAYITEPKTSNPFRVAIVPTEAQNPNYRDVKISYLPSTPGWKAASDPTKPDGILRLSIVGRESDIPLKVIP
ncbi:hypothetical protein [Arthrobacter sp. P2b]|uniref:hypothetical protein n=1 Tax=Arthrobacter sp. P2b TaxID=1938741 RepID=UPI0009D4BB6F|nr:hypothetical protein [Arthrobacter sp. P2b]SLK00944.1 hypothetical protein SAMN06272721_103202 [Arthrobacter sp. P2b]